MFLLYRQNFTQFWPGKYDFNLFKGFFMEKMTQICQIWIKKNSTIARFLWWCCSKSGHNQPQEDLAKSGYKKNREIKNLRIQHMLMYLWNLLAKYENLKRRKLKICPNPSKILMSSELSFSKCGDSFWKFPKKFLDHVACNFVFNNKMMNFCHQINHSCAVVKLCVN